MSAGTLALLLSVHSGPEGFVGWAATGPASAAQSESAMKIRVTCLDICHSSVLPGSAEPDRMGLLPSIPRRALAPHLADQVRKLGNDELFQGQPAGIGRSRQREEHAPLNHPALRSREHGRRADLLVREHAEKLAEAGQPLVEEPFDRLERRVAARDARTTGQYERFHRGRSEEHTSELQ